MTFFVLPGSSVDEVQPAFEKKAGVLRAELISGASPKVVAAAGRARTTLEAGRHILTDPASRQRYDAEIGSRRTGGGLSGPELVPSRDPWAWDARIGMDAAAMDALGDWLAAAQGAALRELMERMGYSSARAALIYLHATRRA